MLLGHGSFYPQRTSRHYKCASLGFFCAEAVYSALHVAEASSHYVRRNKPKADFVAHYYEVALRRGSVAEL